MIPIIKKDKSHFLFNALLNKEEISLIKNYIGKKISYLWLEQLNLLLKPNVRISCMGKCNFQFAGNKLETQHLQFCSHHKEYGTIPSQGGISFQQVVTKHKRGIEGLLNPPQFISKSFINKIDYPNQTPIVAIQFYGHKMNASIKGLDGWADVEYFKEIGYENYPEIDCNSIEFIVFLHENNLKTIISLETGGFWFNLNYEKEIDEEIISKSYVIENGYKKNIILHHDVK